LKIGIFAPYLATCGGGEKYILSIAKALASRNFVEIILFNDFNKEAIHDKLNINFDNVSIRVLKKYIKLKGQTLLENIINYYMVSIVSSQYDIFINQEHNSYIYPMAKKNVIICEVPPIKIANNTNIIKRYFKRYLFDSELRRYALIITNSNFTKHWVQKRYDNKSVTLYPFVNTDHFYSLNKENIILSVGRFFIKGHSKRQLDMIRAFKQLYDEDIKIKEWSYHLVGGIDEDLENKRYLKQCIEEARSYPIYIHCNMPYLALQKMYGLSKIFWSATGLNVNESLNPENVEHFGISNLEAMSAGCVPVIINKGGHREIVRNNINGYLWDNINQLKKLTLNIIDSDSLLNKFSMESVSASKEFSLNVFNERVESIFESYL